MSAREEYVQKMHELLDKLNAEIDVLASKAEHAEDEVREEYRQQITHLRARQHDAKAKLASLRNAGESAWEDLKAGVDMAKEAIGEALESARSRFSK
ncbi:MAG: coiled coil domain-containing protein [Thiobacillaceae bacterium]|jgi:predicted  nucleic acid-binding Zn-ribbon protein|nr:coiled coil domain-containing protein [Thiobacillaceae bacterium]